MVALNMKEVRLFIIHVITLEALIFLPLEKKNKRKVFKQVI
jgi:hypothetical protein